MEELGLWRTGRSLETCYEAVDVAQDPKVSDQLSIEREDRSAVPPDMPSCGLHLKELLPVIAMKPKLSEDLVTVLSEGEDVGRVAIERTRNELHIPYELLVANQLWT